MARAPVSSEAIELAARIKAAADKVYALSQNEGFQLFMEQIALEADEAKEKLVLMSLDDLTPEERKKVRELQARVRGFVWLKDMIEGIVRKGDQLETLEAADAELGANDAEGTGA